MNIKIDKFQCHCEACRFDYPVEEEWPVNDQISANSIMLHSMSAGQGLAGYPVSMMEQLEMFCDCYQQMAADYPNRELIQYERLIHQTMLMICKFQSVWPLLRREFFQNSPFLPIGIPANVAYFVHERFVPPR
jgi:hypothetical protein